MGDTSLYKVLKSPNYYVTSLCLMSFQTDTETTNNSHDNHVFQISALVSSLVFSKEQLIESEMKRPNRSCVLS